MRGLCDACEGFEKLPPYEKQCRVCEQRMQPTQLRWGTGMCDLCWDQAKQQAATRDAGGAMRRGLVAARWVQGAGRRTAGAARRQVFAGERPSVGAGRREFESKWLRIRRMTR